MTFKDTQGHYNCCYYLGHIRVSLPISGPWGVVCVILSLAVLIQDRRATDTHARTRGRRWLPHLPSVQPGKLDYTTRINLSTYGDRAFAFARPTTWNCLPNNQKDIKYLKRVRSLLSLLEAIQCRVVNNTGKKYCNIQYQYQAKKVLPIPIPITL